MQAFKLSLANNVENCILYQTEESKSYNQEEEIQNDINDIFKEGLCFISMIFTLRLKKLFCFASD